MPWSFTAAGPPWCKGTSQGFLGEYLSAVHGVRTGTRFHPHAHPRCAGLAAKLPALVPAENGGADAGLPFLLNLAGLLIGLFGAAFSIWAISYLRASFGLRAAVRELVTTGPYRRIRHPLYFGEIIHIFGISILSATPAGLYLFVVAVALQVVRAKIEERKFLASVPEYAEFRRNTGFLWPRLFKPQAPPVD